MQNKLEKSRNMFRIQSGVHYNKYTLWGNPLPLEIKEFDTYAHDYNLIELSADRKLKR